MWKLDNIVLNLKRGQRKTKKENKKYLETNVKVNKTYQNLCDIEKAISFEGSLQ